MRKQNPNDVIDAFHHELNESIDTWNRLRQEVGTAGDLAKRVSVDAFQRAAVAFEGFRSDWHIASINRDSTQFKSVLTQKVEQSVASRWRGLQGRVSVDLPKHPSLELVRELLDPDGQNVSLGSYAIWKDKAEEQLCTQFSTPLVGLPVQDRAVVDAVIAVRNLLSHRSQRASKGMNEALRALHGHQDGALRRGPNRPEPSGIGNYLNADRDGQRRVEIFHHRLQDISERLRVS